MSSSFIGMHKSKYWKKTFYIKKSLTSGDGGQFFDFVGDHNNFTAPKVLNNKKTTSEKKEKTGH